MTPQRIFYLQTLQKSPKFENALNFKAISQNYSFLKGLEADLEAAKDQKGGYKERKKKTLQLWGIEPGISRLRDRRVSQLSHLAHQ